MKVLYVAIVLSVSTVPLHSYPDGNKHNKDSISQKGCVEHAQDSISAKNYNAALNILHGCSSSVERDAVLGLVYHRLYKPDSAIVFLRKAYEANHYDDNLLLSLAQTLIWKKNTGEARAVLNKVNNKKTVFYKTRLASYYSATGNFSKALSIYNEILAENKNLSAVKMKKAELLSWMKKLNESIKFYTEIIENKNALRLARISARIKRAEIMAWMGELNKAEQEIKEVIKEAPSNSEAHKLISKIKSWKRNSEKAQVKKVK